LRVDFSLQFVILWRLNCMRILTMNPVKLVITGISIANEIQRLIEFYPELNDDGKINYLATLSTQWVNEFNKEVYNV